MRQRLFSVLAVLILVVTAFIIASRELQFKPDYSDVTLQYENDGKNRYYYGNLSPNAKTAYTMILPKLYEHSEKIEIPELTDEEFDLLIYALSYDNPDLFCLDIQSRMESDGDVFYYSPSYTHSKEECQSKRAELDSAVQKALSGVSTDADDYEKELYVHDYICKICTYNMDSDEQKNRSVYDVFVDGSAVCEGYAKAAKLLLDKLSVSNYLVTGDTEDENGEISGHMWNVVSINSENYHFDVTWDDIDTNEIFEPNHIYFNLTDEMIQKTHFNLNPKENNCNSTKFNYYNQIKMCFSRYDDTARKSIVNNIYSNYKNGNNICEFKFTDEKEYKKAFNELIEGDGLTRIFEELYQTHNDLNFENAQYIKDDKLYAFMFAFS